MLLRTAEASLSQSPSMSLPREFPNVLETLSEAGVYPYELLILLNPKNFILSKLQECKKMLNIMIDIVKKTLNKDVNILLIKLFV
ncbi:MAG: hypothetical protein RMJ36_06840 [Candidatus Calescibacterium sp.]|nr:hypothetical protein [Candidatus Calescibacterium sp.]MDW8133352.1 hypothetical protein [Candidatus Calescibacterium sp.]